MNEADGVDNTEVDGADKGKTETGAVRGTRYYGAPPVGIQAKVPYHLLTFHEAKDWRDAKHQREKAEAEALGLPFDNQEPKKPYDWREHMNDRPARDRLVKKKND